MTVPIGVLQRRTTAGATFAHTLVVVEPEASLTLVQQHGSPETLDGRAFHHGVTELLIGERASVQYLSLQEWGSEQVNHFAVQRALVGRQARFRSFVVTLGGGVVRVSPEVVLGEGAEADLLGAVFADAGQRFEHRANVTHAEPHARSSLLYKAGLLGGSRNIFNGNLIISPGARGTDAGQTMRNLVLSRDAHAEANPFLEILNSDVKAAHAAATGRVDDLHLFYLESRGIPRRTARRLVVFGFFEEVLAQVTMPGGPPPPRGGPGGRAGGGRGRPGGQRRGRPGDAVRAAGRALGARARPGAPGRARRRGGGRPDPHQRRRRPRRDRRVQPRGLPAVRGLGRGPHHRVRPARQPLRPAPPASPTAPPALRPVQIFPVRVEGEDVLVDLPDDWAKLAKDL